MIYLYYNADGPNNQQNRGFYDAKASITLALELTLKGEVTNEHAVQMALKEIRQRVAGMTVEEVKGE